MLVAVDLTPSLPLSRNAAVVLVILLFVGFNWALLGLLYRFSASTWRWFMPLLNGTTALMLLASLAIIAFADQIDRLRWVALPILPLRLVGTAMLAQWAWHERSWRAIALSAAEMVWFIGFMQFVLIALGVLPNWPFLLTPADGLLLYAVLVFSFVDRFIVDREAAARAQLQAVNDERHRILRDMHDGMGAQLITASRLAQRPDVDRALITQNIDDALQDMRLIIDSLDMADHDLLPLLGNLRFRLQPRLQALGIRLEWDVQPLVEADGPAPHAALSVLRVVQEALNNALRHGQVRAIGVTIRPHQGGVLIRVADDGVGFDVDAARAGHGLPGMQQRAAEIGARLDVAAGSAGGTVVSLWLPKAAGHRYRLT
jgi:signal transduction histidine kinase